MLLHGCTDPQTTVDVECECVAETEVFLGIRQIQLCEHLKSKMAATFSKMATSFAFLDIPLMRFIRFER